MLLAIEHIDQELWKDGMIFKNGNLKFSVHGTEFEALLQRMIQNHPEKFYQIARNGMS